MLRSVDLWCLFNYFIAVGNDYPTTSLMSVHNEEVFCLAGSAVPKCSSKAKFPLTSIYFFTLSMIWGSILLPNNKDLIQLLNTLPMIDMRPSYSTTDKLVEIVPSIIFLWFFLLFRYSAEIVHRWGLTGFDLQAEPPSPEYLMKLSKAKKKKLNIVTQLQEPVVPFWRVKLPSLILSFTLAFFWSLIALAVVFSVVIYRMSYITSDSLYR